MFDKLQNSSQRRDISLAVVAFLVAFALWQMQGASFLMYPFRLFVTMIHELGHGLAAIFTGGSFERFEVSKYGAGLAYTRGGSRFVIIQAGYLGTALFGAALLYLTNRSKRPDMVAIAVGLLIGILALLYANPNLSGLSVIEMVLAGMVIIVAIYLFLTRETNEGRYVGVGVGMFGGLLLMMFAGWDNTLTIVVGLVSALILGVLGLRANREIVVITLTFLAFLTGLQAIADAWVLLKIVSLPSMVPNNDASSMADAYAGSATVWALIWITLDILIFGTAMYLTFIRPVRQGQPAPPPKTEV